MNSSQDIVEHKMGLSRKDQTKHSTLIRLGPVWDPVKKIFTFS